MIFNKCPRCNTRSFERFPMYGFCHDCDYLEVKRNRREPQEKIKKSTDDCKMPRLFNTEGDDDWENQFTKEDHKVVRKALLCIPEREQRVVFLYFWKDEKRQEIAEKLAMTEEQVDRILSSAYSRLRPICINNPRLSRVLSVFDEAA